MSTVTIRQANMDDIEFLTEAVIAAEQSGTGRSGLAKIHGLTEDALPALVKTMFEEEVDGCELSVSSFLLAINDKEPVAAVAGWVEGGVDGVPSGSLRTNLVGYTFPGSALEALRENGQAAVDLKLDRDEGALQIEYVYVSPAERGKRLATKLIQAHIDRIKGSDQVPGKVQIQVFNNNDKALSAYLAMGFQVVRTARSQDPRALELLPFNEKSLLELTL